MPKCAQYLKVKSRWTVSERRAYIISMAFLRNGLIEKIKIKRRCVWRHVPRKKYTKIMRDHRRSVIRMVKVFRLSNIGLDRKRITRTRAEQLSRVYSRTCDFLFRFRTQRSSLFLNSFLESFMPRGEKVN